MWRPLVSVITTLLLRCNYFSTLSVVSRVFSALCVYSKFGHHPHPLGYLVVPNFVSFMASVAELPHGEKLRTQSLIQLI